MNNKNKKGIKNVLKALKNARLDIVLAIGTNTYLSVAEIVEETGHEQSLVSHHLKTLRDAKLVDREVNGKKRIYFLIENQYVSLLGDLFKK